MRRRRKKTTRGEYVLLLIIIFLVFFLPDFYLHVRQKYFSKDLNIYHVGDIRYNRITQEYEDISKSGEESNVIKHDESEGDAANAGASSEGANDQGEENQAGQANAQNEQNAQNSENAENGPNAQNSENAQNQQSESDSANSLHSANQVDHENFQIRVVKLIDDAPTQEQVFVTNSQIAIISEKKLTAYSKTGEKKWEADINAPEPYIIKSKDFIYIINKQKGDIAKLNSDNEIVAIVQNLGKITEIKAGEDKLVFTSENPNDFKVLDENLELHSYFTVPYGDVVDFEISSDSKNIIINIIRIDKFELESFILTYDVRGQIIGTADIDKQLVYSMKLDENMIVVSDTALLSFDKNGLKSTEIPNTSSLIDVATYQDKVYTLGVSEKNQEFTDITIYSQYLNKLGELQVESAKEGILVGEKFCIVYDYKDLELYDKRLNFISKYQINENIDKIEWIDDYSFAIIGEGIVNLYEIR